MRIHKSGHEINSLEDWFHCAPPKKGDLHWKDGRSAKELARSWLKSQPPHEVRSLLETTFGTGIVFKEAEPECIVQLDDFRGEQRNCDLVVVCESGSRRIVVSVEAKADEPFGDYVGHYYDLKLNTRSNVPNRIRQLSMALFGREPDGPIRELRYQLLHSAAAALIAARERDGECAVFLVQEFHSAKLDPKKVKQNKTDWERFVGSLTGKATEVVNNRILGPISVRGDGRVPSSIPLYLAKVVIEMEASVGAQS